MMLKVIGLPWLGLGFYRGIQYYNYNYKCNCIDYEKAKLNKPNYYYSNCFESGMFGMFCYAFPFYLPTTISKEIYRIEVNLRRDLDEEKETKYYYQLK